MKGDNFSRRDSSKREEKNKEKEEDMLPELPDEIIVHILSFVHAKTAVQTSVLNKRYRNLWASLPVFNFDDSSFQDAMSFEVFVDNFLSCRDTSTNVFNVYLDCHYDVYNDHVVDSIIDHVIDTPSITTTIEVLSMFSDELEDESSPFTRMQTFELKCDDLPPLPCLRTYKNICLVHLVDLIYMDVKVLSMFPYELEDKCSPFTRMQTFELITGVHNFELICDASSSAMPRDEQYGKTNIVEDVFLWGS
ncbi:hypothetical protein VIGAN_03026100 [Vigna angularis var. angularis]|uniref:F-box domain-containing protein n=1 Tax=Vigna angularis var. angularis TaxID=157739 RepID=A0A0S3RJ48_PHAAN|nr:hypothetical protein VIGAN_03026100 [Vigna angularis var. angularis]